MTIRPTTPPVKPQQYRLKPTPNLEAIRLTVDNIDSVAAWCGGRVVRETKPSDPTDVYTALDIPTLNGNKRANTHTGGDYVIRDQHGAFYPAEAELFEANYERIGIRSA